MASSLSTAQAIDLFRMLEVPFNGLVWQPEGEFNIMYREYTIENSDYNLQVKIMERLDELTSDEETWLVQRINEWQLVGTNTAAIDGSVGGVNGVTYDPEKQRSNIRADVKTLIPVMRYREELSIYEDQRRAGAGFWSPGSRS